MNIFVKKIFAGILTFLFCTLILFTYIITNDISTNTLSQNIAWPSKNFIPASGKKVITQFTAEHDYLGLIRINIDETKQETKPIAFRIKEVGKKNWFFEKNDFDYFFNFPVAPVDLGFPVISNSKNKTYIFEIEAGKIGTNQAKLVDNKIINFSLDNRHFATAKYNFPTTLLFENPQNLKEFLNSKFIFFLQKWDLYFIVILFFSPFFIYLIFMIWLKKRFNKNLSLFVDYIKKTITLLTPFFLFLILMDVKISYDKNNNIMFFLILMLWVCLSFLTKISSQKTYAMALLSLIASAFFLLVNYEKYSAKISYYAYYFFVIGLIFNIIEVIRGREKQRIYEKKIKSKIITYSVILIVAIVLIFFYCPDLKNNFIPKCQENCLNPKITSIEPMYVYPGQKIILAGKNFCNNDRTTCSVVVSNKIPVYADLMSGGKIIFTVPFDWKENSDFYVKVAKKISLSGKFKTAESNAVRFKLLNPLSPWSADTDAYFEQLKNLSDEAKEINGLD